jgi:hypothetical protein
MTANKNGEAPEAWLLRRLLRFTQLRRPTGGGYNMTLLTTIPHASTAVYSQISKHSGLLTLLDYALYHSHSRLWISAIQMLLARRGGQG